ncbi:MAG: MoaD/ThiS family protein [Solirubrobacteraceae bacterium]|nr:MoaD/ThiS family protein [Solirubrobacteraceae bacterium]
MTVTVRLFATLRREAGVGELELELDEPATVADAIAALRAGPLPWLPDRATFAVAVDREYAADDVPVRPGSELALVPPVSGG